MRISLLDQKHPDYCASSQAEWRALHDGPGKRDTHLWDTWLPRRPSESVERWGSRKSSATFKAEAGGMLDMLTGYLFSTPLTVGDTPSEWWATWLDDVDRRGCSYSSYVGDRLADALVGGAAYTAVMLPSRDTQPTTRLDEEALGLLDAYLVSYTAEQVIRWGEDEHGRLTWLVAKDTRPVNVPFEEIEHVNRWTYIDDTVIRVWEAPADAGGDDEASEVASVEHGFGRIPVARLHLPATLHAMRRLRDPAVALLRTRSARQWAVEQSAYAMLAIHSDRNLTALEGGEGWWMQLPTDAKAEWLEPGGASLAALAEDISTSRDDLYRAMHSLTQSAHSDSLQGQSGVSKSMDWQAFEVVLSAYAELVIDHAQDIVELVGVARGEDTGGVTVTGLDGYQSEDPCTYLTHAVLGADLVRHSPTAQRLVARRAVDALLPDISPEERETIAGELDEADFSPLSVPFSVAG